MAKIKRKRPQTIATFDIEGIDDRRALTISFIPLFLEIILSGRRALNALKAFTDWRLEPMLEASSPSNYVPKLLLVDMVT